jgi:hypothetical protein
MVDSAAHYRVLFAKHYCWMLGTAFEDAVTEQRRQFTELGIVPGQSSSVRCAERESLKRSTCSTCFTKIRLSQWGRAYVTAQTRRAAPVEVTVVPTEG